MNYREYISQRISLKDTNGNIWTGVVEAATSYLDSSTGENEIAVMTSTGLVEFEESEIEEITLMG